MKIFKYNVRYHDYEEHYKTVSVAKMRICGRNFKDAKRNLNAWIKRENKKTMPYARYDYIK